MDTETEEILAKARQDYKDGKIEYWQLQDIYLSCAKAEVDLTLDSEEEKV